MHRFVLPMSHDVGVFGSCDHCCRYNSAITVCFFRKLNIDPISRKYSLIIIVIIRIAVNSPFVSRPEIRAYRSSMSMNPRSILIIKHFILIVL